MAGLRLWSQRAAGRRESEREREKSRFANSGQLAVLYQSGRPPEEPFLLERSSPSLSAPRDATYADCALPQDSPSRAAASKRGGRSPEGVTVR